MDVETLRTRIERIESVLASLPTIGDSSTGGICMLAVTFREAVYPTSAGAVFACHPAIPGGNEVEGAAGSITVPGSAATIYAINQGSRIPPEGTPILCEYQGNRWTFRYDG